MRVWTAAGTLVLLLAIGGVTSGQQPAGETLRWYKGNTHTHTLNSDGDSTPDDVVRWYREQKYHFVVITDHNLVTPVDGLNAMYAAPERFLVIRGEEVTDSSADKKPVHLNLIGGDGFVAPQGGATPAEALRRDIAAMLVAKGVISINHPNFGWALTADDLLSGKGADVLEIANAHPQVNNSGGGISPGTEALWDAMLSAGITIYGAASDDMHELKRPWSKAAARPGQGWIVVRAPRLTAEAILASMRRGDFYASTGVELTDIQATPQRVTLAIKEQSSSRYTVRSSAAAGAC